jgi:uncharacterized protein (DUF302 family)
MTIDGLTARRSDFDPGQTMERLVAAIEQQGINVLARIDHAGAAAKAGLQLRPTELLIFGNPKAGTSLMNAAQTLGIDLPLKVLVWQEADGQTWLGYNEPRFLARRHGIESGFEKILDAMTGTLERVAKAATKRGGHATP